MKIINIFCFICMLLFSINVCADELNVSVDKNVLSEGDTLYLTIEYDGDSNENPDLSSLQNDFKIVSNSTSKQITFINGVLEQTKRWTIGVNPIKNGKITIKPIKLGGLSSNFLDVEVKKLTNVAYIPDSKNNQNSPYFKIEQSTDLTNAYLNQQVILYVTVYDSLGLRNGTININENAKDDWMIIPLLKNPIVKKDIINDRHMNVINFIYAIFPQKTGKIMLPQFSFEGEYVKDIGFSAPDFGDDLFMFGMDFRNAFGQKIPVRMKTDDKNIDILPPKDGQSLIKWLPLKNLQISSFIGQKNNFVVGEAFNQKIIVKATGTIQSLLPSLNFPQIEGVKQYPEKPEITEEIVNGDIITTATYNIVYIPTQKGEITIPSVKIEWFNVKNNKFETSSTDEVDVVIAKNENSDQLFSDNTSQNNDENLEQNTKKEEEKKPATEKKDRIPLFWYFWGVFVVLMLLIIGLLSKKQNTKTAKYYKKLVISSIQNHDYAQAKLHILEWARIKYKDDNIKNFKDVAEQVKDANFEKGLDSINKLLYSNVDELFDNQDFVKNFKRIDKKKVFIKNKQDILPNLYK